MAFIPITKSYHNNITTPIVYYVGKARKISYQITPNGGCYVDYSISSLISISNSSLRLVALLGALRAVESRRSDVLRTRRRII